MKIKYFILFITISLSLCTKIYAGPINNGLVGYWQFNGNGEDSTANNLDGSTMGSASYQYIDNVFHEALYINNGSYFQVPSNNLLNFTSEITISLWIKPNNLSSYQALVAKWANTASPAPASDRSYLFYILNSTLFPYISTNQQYVNLQTASILKTSEWQQVAMTYSDTTDLLKVYVNGLFVKQATGSGVMPFNNNMPLLFGYFSYSPGVYYYSGYMDEVKVFSRSLNENEIFNDYEYVLNGMPSTIPEPGTFILCSITIMSLIRKFKNKD